MSPLRLLPAVVVLGVLTASALAARSPTGVIYPQTVRRAQLDRDRPLETLRIVTTHRHPESCNGPGCSRLVLIDGQRSVRLSSFLQAGRGAGYGWRIARVWTVDLTGDGVREVIWDQGTNGATGTSPRRYAAVRWDGHHLRRIFSLSSASGGLPVALRVRGGRTPELFTRELLYRESDYPCCASSVRRRHYRFDGRRMAVVRERVTHNRP